MLVSSLLLLVIVSAAPTARQNGLTVVNNCYNIGQVALTFDGKLFSFRVAPIADTSDGPYTHDYDVANALNSVGAKGTFFLNVCDNLSFFPLSCS